MHKLNVINVMTSGDIAVVRQDGIGTLRIPILSDEEPINLTCSESSIRSVHDPGVDIAPLCQALPRLMKRT
jgi:hypothetical protein